MTTSFAPRVGVAAKEAVIVAVPAVPELEREQERVVGFGFDDPVGRGIHYIRAQRFDLARDGGHVAEPVAKPVDVVGAQRTEQAAAGGLGRLPRQRPRLRRDIAIEEQLDRAKAKLADVPVVEKLLDVAALRRVPELVSDHRRSSARLRRIAHFGRLLRIDRERFLAENMLAGPERRDGELAVSAGRGRDRDGVEIVAPDQLQRVGVHVLDAGGPAQPSPPFRDGGCTPPRLPSLRTAGREYTPARQSRRR
jgi:hypothetical protein